MTIVLKYRDFNQALDFRLEAPSPARSKPIPYRLVILFCYSLSGIIPTNAKLGIICCN